MMVLGMNVLVLIGWAFGLIALIVCFVLILGIYGGGNKDKKKLTPEEKAVAKAEKKTKAARKKQSLVVKGEKVSKADQVSNVFTPEPGVFNPSIKRDAFDFGQPASPVPPASPAVNPVATQVPATPQPPVQPVRPAVATPPAINTPPRLQTPPTVHRPNVASPPSGPANPNAKTLQDLLKEEAQGDDLLDQLRNKNQ